MRRVRRVRGGRGDGCTRRDHNREGTAEGVDDDVNKCWKKMLVSELKPNSKAYTDRATHRC